MRRAKGRRQAARRARGHTGRRPAGRGTRTASAPPHPPTPPASPLPPPRAMARPLPGAAGLPPRATPASPLPPPRATARPLPGAAGSLPRATPASPLPPTPRATARPLPGAAGLPPRATPAFSAFHRRRAQWRVRIGGWEVCLRRAGARSGFRRGRWRARAARTCAWRRAICPSSRTSATSSRRTSRRSTCPKRPESPASCGVPRPCRRRTKRRTTIRRSTLLAESDGVTENHRDADMEKARLLEETLQQFGISSTLTGIAHGPAVTRFELAPAPGVKVSRITSLADDIAMHLGGDVGTHRGAHSRQGRRGRGDSQREGGDGAAARRAGVRRGAQEHVEDRRRARQGQFRPLHRRRHRQDAARAHRRSDRFRQVGVHQLDHHLDSLSRRAR